MIVPMKKVSLVTLESEKEEALNELGKLGILHIDVVKPESPKLTLLWQEREILEKALGLLQKEEGGRKNKKTSYDLDRVLKLSRELVELNTKRESLNQELLKRIQEREKVQGWGDFDPELVAELAKAGVHLKLYRLKEKEIKDIPEGMYFFIIKKEKQTRFICCLSMGKEPELPFKEDSLPSLRLKAVESEIARLQKEIEKINAAIAAYAKHYPLLQNGKNTVSEQITFWEVEASMASGERLSYLNGFAPVTSLATLRQAARSNGWALLIQEPEQGDEVPTLVKNNRFISIVRPVFAFLGTVPGYKEKEISPFFLLFFSIFYGMLIGDAAYGCLFLLFSLGLYLFAPRSVKQLAGLLIITSLTTIGWGSITGTWFNISSEVILATPPFSWLAVPALVATPKNDTTSLMMHICFIIGVVHLSLAHLWNMITKFPKIKFLSDVGWLSVIWGGYFIIRFLVLKYPLFEFAPYLFLGGFGLVLLTGEQNGNFFKGLLIGLAKFPLTFLSSIGALADIISYVRLFAVGLAGVKVEEAFNSMAMGFGFAFPGIIGLILVLFLGHSLNMVLGVMSVIVHGIRLNMLEFSGHLGLEWSGREYKPFKLRASTLGDKKY
jgi:V/A-type H+-transporting ATPase subunit I